MFVHYSILITCYSSIWIKKNFANFIIYPKASLNLSADDQFVWTYVLIIIWSTLITLITEIPVLSKLVWKIKKNFLTFCCLFPRVESKMERWAIVVNMLSFWIKMNSIKTVIIMWRNRLQSIMRVGINYKLVRYEWINIQHYQKQMFRVCGYFQWWMESFVDVLPPTEEYHLCKLVCTYYALT